MEFTECEPAATDAELDAVESRFGLRFPSALRHVFRVANGGRPVCRCAGRYGDRHTGISECLVLSGRTGSASWTYDLFALSKKVIPTHLFPFAVDPGGDCFLADCSSADGDVVLYVHDTAFEHLRPLHLTLEQFWDCSFRATDS
jgi:SMI1/KNR4 family protein SUKH-1